MCIRICTHKYTYTTMHVLQDRLAVSQCCSLLQCVVCSLLQCVVVYCNVLQCVAECCSVLQCVAVCCSVLQDWLAVCCSVLQCIAECCRVSQDGLAIFDRMHVYKKTWKYSKTQYRVGSHNPLQPATICCNPLLLTATSLKSIAAPCNTLHYGIVANATYLAISLSSSVVPSFAVSVL